MGVQPPECKHDKTEQGFTLIEVLAAVIILSLFVATLLTLFGDLLIQLQQSDQKHQALVIARAELGQMAAAGAATTIHGPAPDPQTIHGVTYRSAWSLQTSSPPVPTWAQGMVYAEVTVSWNTLVNGQLQPRSVTVDQVFPK